MGGSKMSKSGSSKIKKCFKQVSRLHWRTVVLQHNFFYLKKIVQKISSSLYIYKKKKV
jgi:hypothetical protein